MKNISRHHHCNHPAPVLDKSQSGWSNPISELDSAFEVLDEGLGEDNQNVSEVETFSLRKRR
jgi:hypothetical protein